MIVRISIFVSFALFLVAIFQSEAWSRERPFAMEDHLDSGWRNYSKQLIEALAPRKLRAHGTDGYEVLDDRGELLGRIQAFESHKKPEGGKGAIELLEQRLLVFSKDNQEPSVELRWKRRGKNLIPSGLKKIVFADVLPLRGQGEETLLFELCPGPACYEIYLAEGLATYSIPFEFGKTEFLRVETQATEGNENGRKVVIKEVLLRLNSSESLLGNDAGKVYTYRLRRGEGDVLGGERFYISGPRNAEREVIAGEFQTLFSGLIQNNVGSLLALAQQQILSIFQTEEEKKEGIRVVF